MFPYMIKVAKQANETYFKIFRRLSKFFLEAQQTLRVTYKVYLLF